MPDKKKSQDVSLSVVSPIYSLSIDSILPNPRQPRKLFDERYIDELAASILKDGLYHPIIVRPHPYEKEGVYEIISGECRWRASKKVGKKDIDVILKDVADEEVPLIALLENIQRKDLNVLEEALGYKTVMEVQGCTHEALASKVNKSRAHISNVLRLLTLPEDVQSLVLKNQLSVGHAKLLVGQPLASSLAIFFLNEKLSVREAEAFLEKFKRGEKALPNFSMEKEISEKSVSAPHAEGSSTEHDLALRELKMCLENALGMRVDIQCCEKTNVGKITVYFKNRDHLDSLCQRLVVFYEERAYE